MKNLFLYIGIAAVLGGGLFTAYTQVSQKPLAIYEAPKAGNFNPTGGGTYYLQASINSNQTTITLSSFTEPSSGIPYTMSYLNSSIEYGTINPNSPTSEFISFTGITQNTNGTAILTGVTRGLGRSYPYTASTTLAHSVPGQTQFILSAPPQFYNQYANLSNPQVITGQWQFNVLPTSTQVCTSGTQLCNKNYIDGGLSQGAATSTFSNMGIVTLATSVQIGSSTASSTNGFQGGAPLVIPSKFATTTPGRLCNTGIWNCIPVAQVSGFISQAWLDLTQAFTFSTTTQYFANTGSLVATTSARLPANTTIGGLTPLFTSVTPRYAIAQTSFTVTNGFATSSILSVPAGVLTASSTISLQVNGTCTHGASSGICTVGVSSSSGTPLFTCSDGQTSTSVNFQQQLVATTIGINSASSQQTIGNLISNQAANSGVAATVFVQTCNAVSAVNLASATNLVVVIDGSAAQMSPSYNFVLTVNP